ncbi:helix-turn-helix transcriptional regulator [Acidithiobacillus sp. IBUN Pt1247-S3]|uniref:helix-turn-helix transcriptional regulator n=1 Tax=Acidithiobacillus sp. IBUN Pt1247-S3 TaxID=3166642 RepID=UPI0034E597D9
MEPLVLNLKAVQERTTLCKSEIYKRIKNGDNFPAPRKITENRSVWVAAEVDAWILSRIGEGV